MIKAKGKNRVWVRIRRSFLRQQATTSSLSQLLIPGRQPMWNQVFSQIVKNLLHVWFQNKTKEPLIPGRQEMWNKVFICRILQIMLCHICEIHGSERPTPDNLHKKDKTSTVFFKITEFSESNEKCCQKGKMWTRSGLLSLDLNSRGFPVHWSEAWEDI